MNAQEYKAAQDLARQGWTFKKAHQFLSLRVYWDQGAEEKSAILCSKHRNAQYKQSPQMWDKYEFFPTTHIPDRAGRTIHTAHSKSAATPEAFALTGMRLTHFVQTFDTSHRLNCSDS
jgi:hypothetical protein